MSSKFPRVIYRGKGEVNNVPDNFHWFDCRRDARHAYPTAEAWDKETWEQLACWMPREGEEAEADAPARDIINLVDVTFCEAAAPHEEWWTWLTERKVEAFPNAAFWIYRGRVDSHYTSVVINDDNLAMMFKQAFQGA